MVVQDGRCQANWKREFTLPWRKAGPPNHHNDEVVSDQQVANKQLSLSLRRTSRVDSGISGFGIRDSGPRGHSLAAVGSAILGIQDSDFGVRS